jgi:hypothetical protein
VENGVLLYAGDEDELLAVAIDLFLEDEGLQV